MLTDELEVSLRKGRKAAVAIWWFEFFASLANSAVGRLVITAGVLWSIWHFAIAPLNH